jgi:hypothetical protein
MWPCLLVVVRFRSSDFLHEAFTFGFHPQDKHLLLTDPLARFEYGLEFVE